MSCTRFEANGVAVELEDIGEGLNGDYDPTDPEDYPHLRFTVLRALGDAWEEVDDASYCTRIPADTDGAQLEKIVRHIHAEVKDKVLGGASIKKICEGLSWLEV